MLWILNTGAQWHMLPQSYPNYKTVHRRFQQWCQKEVIRAALTDLAKALREQGAVHESECFIDATFASAKGDGERVAAICSLLGTAQLNGLNVEAYLRHVLERLPDHPVNRLDELLPWAIAAELPSLRMAA